ncbi:MAG: hypothetical protein LUM44_12785 [Pyrinomonadaceae bacterium]|nr:hypothetical protein [Pyrinomonadaceae bacterium]
MSTTLDMEFLETCRRHFDIFKNEARWNHSNPRLSIARLEAKFNSGFPIANKISEELAPYQIEVNQRQELYARIDTWARSARRYLKSSGATQREIDDANVIFNALLGQKTKAKPPQNTEGSAGNAAASHEKLQLSYAAKLANLQAARAFLANVTAFTPNEEHLKLTALDAFIAECTAANEAVSAKFVPLNDAWNERDEVLYTNEDSILNDFRLAKEYYKSLYNAKDPQYKAITAKNMKLTDNSRNSR